MERPFGEGETDQNWMKIYILFILPNGEIGYQLIFGISFLRKTPGSVLRRVPIFWGIGQGSNLIGAPGHDWGLPYWCNIILYKIVRI